MNHCVELKNIQVGIKWLSSCQVRIDSNLEVDGVFFPVERMTILCQRFVPNYQGKRSSTVVFVFTWRWYRWETGSRQHEIHHRESSVSEKWTIWSVEKHLWANPRLKNIPKMKSENFLSFVPSKETVSKLISLNSKREKKLRLTSRISHLVCLVSLVWMFFRVKIQSNLQMIFSRVTSSLRSMRKNRAIWLCCSPGSHLSSSWLIWSSRVSDPIFILTDERRTRMMDRTADWAEEFISSRSSSRMTIKARANLSLGSLRNSSKTDFVDWSESVSDLRVDGIERSYPEDQQCHELQKFSLSLSDHHRVATVCSTG